MGTHTPGPWKLDERIGYTDIRAKVIQDTGGRKMQRLLRLQPFEPGIAPEPAERAEWKANARLIAAAPELLDALRNARAVLASTETAPSWDADRRRVLDEIAAVLAKARGES